MTQDYIDNNTFLNNKMNSQKLLQELQQFDIKIREKIFETIKKILSDEDIKEIIGRVQQAYDASYNSVHPIAIDIFKENPDASARKDLLIWAPFILRIWHDFKENPPVD